VIVSNFASKREKKLSEFFVFVRDGGNVSMSHFASYRKKCKRNWHILVKTVRIFYVYSLGLAHLYLTIKLAVFGLQYCM
jgi:hypothetical protein